MSTALLALHYQNDVLHRDGKIRLGIAEDSPQRASVIDAARRLLTWARQAALPIVHVRIAFGAGHRDVVQNAPIFRNVVRSGAMEEGSWGSAFHEGFEPRPDEWVVTHSRVNAFYDSMLDQRLRALGIRKLILAGVATNSVVEHSARHAADMGFEVTVVSDACSSSDPVLHQAALDNIALLGMVTTVDDLQARGSPS